jgi:hypothetical protein
MPFFSTVATLTQPVTGMTYNPTSYAPVGSHISTSIPYSSHGPASFNIGQPTTSTTYSSRPTTISFPGNVNASPFVPASLLPDPPPVQHGYSGTPGVYTPDDWINHLGTQHASTTRSSVKPPRMKVPNFDGDPRNWPMFIQMFKIFAHDTVNSDAERIAHLHDALTPEIRKNIGGALLNPGLYHHALHELPNRVRQLSSSFSHRAPTRRWFWRVQETGWVRIE